jgi:hypothetical protein
VHTLHEATCAGDLGSIRELLKRKPGLVSAKDSHGQTPLHLAAANGQRDAAELLLGGNSDVNANDVDGWTPLHRAAYEGHKDVVELLLACRARVSAKKNDGHTPLDLAVGQGHKEVAELLRQSMPPPVVGLWRIRWWLAIGVLVCGAFALFFLLKGQNSPFAAMSYSFLDAKSGEIQQYVLGEYDVSAYTYYFTWPQSNRDHESKMEDAVLPVYLQSHGYTLVLMSSEDIESIKAGRIILDRPLPASLSELMARNIRIAAILGLAATLGLIAGVFAYFQNKNQRNKWQTARYTKK